MNKGLSPFYRLDEGAYSSAVRWELPSGKSLSGATPQAVKRSLPFDPTVPRGGAVASGSLTESNFITIYERFDDLSSRLLKSSIVNRHLSGVYRRPSRPAWETRWRNSGRTDSMPWPAETERGLRQVRAKRSMGRGKPTNQSGAEHSLVSEPTGTSPERKREQCSEYRVQIKKQGTLYSAHFIPSLSGE